MKEKEIADLQNHIRILLSKMKISKAIIIDDKIGKNEKVNASELILNVLEGNYDTSEFDIRNVMEKEGLDIDDQKEKAVHGEFSDIIIEILKKEFPEIESLLNSEIAQLILVVKEIFGEENVRTFTNTSEVQEQGLRSDTVLFLDYKLDEKSPQLSRDLVNILSQQNNQTEPKCIVFISKDIYFNINQNIYEMSNSNEKIKYFNELKKQQAETNYKNTLYDFISKHYLTNNLETYEAISEALKNLNGGLVFYELLNVIDKVLVECSQRVLDDFYLLNARSLQELLESKIENEGIAKTTFLMEWIARHLAKSVISNDSIINNINEKIKNISESQLLINEFHEDLALKDIVRSEMWDYSINTRHEPIDFGDVFKIECNGIDRRAILITQSCTLAVRKDGNRASKIGMLILERLSENDHMPNYENESPRYITINCWNNNKITFSSDEASTSTASLDEIITFSLDETITFSLEILDLTTLNQDGYAWISIQEDNEVKLPEAFWTDGYRNKMRVLSGSLIKMAESRKFGAGNGFMPIEQSWLEYKIKKINKSLKYEFPIRRLVRLDYQYAMHIFQKAQSWWGRIGLPVQLNFIDEYKQRSGNININNMNKKITLYIKNGISQNDIIDCCIDMQDLETLLQDIYQDNMGFLGDIEKIVNDNRYIRYNFSSGKRLLSLKASKTAKEYLAQNGIYIVLSEDCQNVNVKIPYFSKCYFNENDVTNQICGIKFTSSGELKCDIPFNIIEKYINGNHKSIINSPDGKVLKYSENKFKEHIEIQISASELVMKTNPNPMKEAISQVAATRPFPGLGDYV